MEGFPSPNKVAQIKREAAEAEKRNANLVAGPDGLMLAQTDPETIKDVNENFLDRSSS